MSVPIVIIIAGGLMLGMVAAGALFVALSHRARRSLGACRHCGHAVSETEGASPRCGACGRLVADVGVVRRRGDANRMLLALGVGMIPLPISGCLGMLGLRGAAYSGQSSTPPAAAGPATPADTIAAPDDGSAPPGAIEHPAESQSAD